MKTSKKQVMEKKYVGISLFNGIGCLWIALEQAGICVSQRISSEVDPHAIKANDAMYPDTIQIGDVRKIEVVKDENGKPIKLITENGVIDIMNDEIILGGGSPCQSFSLAGKMKGMVTKDEVEVLTLDHYMRLKNDEFEFEGQSYLFWEYMRILTEIKPKYFLLENVMMAEKWESILTKAIGVSPISINSALVSAQNRRRLYWLGEIRERLFYSEKYCYICNNEKKKVISETEGILGEAQKEGSSEVLGKAQRRHIGVYNMPKDILQDKSEGNDKDLFKEMPGDKQKGIRQKKRQELTEGLSQNIQQKKQTAHIGLSEEIQKNESGKRSNEESRCQAISETGKDDEVAYVKTDIWPQEEIDKGGDNDHIGNEENMCCVSCGIRLDHRPYHSFVEGWGKLRFKSPNTLSKLQFEEARQNNGRVFDILEIGVKGHDSIFGETLIPIPQPKDRGILLKDILERNVNEKYFLKDNQLKWWNENSEFQLSKRYSSLDADKGITQTARQYASWNGNFVSETEAVGLREVRSEEGKKIRKENNKKGIDYNPHRAKSIEERMDGKTGTLLTSPTADNLIKVSQTLFKDDVNPKETKNKKHQQDAVNDSDGKANCLVAGSSLNPSHFTKTEVKVGDYRHDEGFRWRDNGKSGTLMARAREDGSGQPIAEINSRIRRLTPRECGRLQTFPEDKLDILLKCGISDSRLYHAFGNGWTCEVISFILFHIK